LNAEVSNAAQMSRPVRVGNISTLVVVLPRRIYQIDAWECSHGLVGSAVVAWNSKRLQLNQKGAARQKHGHGEQLPMQPNRASTAPQYSNLLGEGVVLHTDKVNRGLQVVFELPDQLVKVEHASIGAARKYRDARRFLHGLWGRHQAQHAVPESCQMQSDG
jgi:hypothetical protein